MSFGANPLLKKEFIRYVVENNKFERENIVTLKKINEITGEQKYYNNVNKVSSADAEKMLKNVKSSELSNKVKMLKKKNRHLRHFYNKFKKTLDSGLIWEDSVRSVQSISKTMTKGKRKKSLGKRKRKKTKNKKKKGGRKTRRRMRRRRRR